MPSLTSLHPALAPLFGLTEKALYERQNSLVKMKLLPTPQGRGRGSGAEATPENVASLIIAVMATDRQADDERVQQLAYAAFVDGKKDRCPWTDATVFKDALVSVLSPPKATNLRSRDVPIASVRVFRANAAASISFGKWPKIADARSRGEGLSQFGEFYRRADDQLRVETELPAGAVQKIRSMLTERGSS